MPRALTKYQLFVRNHSSDAEVKSLPSKQRLKKISEMWKAHKAGLASGKEPARSSVNVAREIKLERNLNPKVKKDTDKLQASATFPTNVDESKAIPAGTGVINRLTGNTKGFAGEKHAKFLTSKKVLGKDIPVITTANFTGPGTQIEARVSRGDKGVNDIDEASKLHDLDYLRLSKQSRPVTKEQVQKADAAYMARISRTKDDPSMKKFVLAIFASKRVAENAGLLSHLKFVKTGT